MRKTYEIEATDYKRKTYKVKATILVDIEWQVEAEDEQEALSKLYARDIKEVIDDSLILDVNSENEEVVED